MLGSVALGSVILFITVNNNHRSWYEMGPSSLVVGNSSNLQDLFLIRLLFAVT
jgi:hypothetical protein